MSEQGTTRPVGNVEFGSSGDSLSKLAELARQAYEQKRTKDCLDLTRAILLIDPENAEAQRMRSSVRSELHVDLENARALLRAEHVGEETNETESQSDDLASSNALPVPVVQAELSSQLTEEQPSVEPLAIVPTVETFVEAPVRKEKRRLKALKRAAVIAIFGLAIASLPRFRSNSNPMELHPSLAAAADATPVDAKNFFPAIAVDDQSYAQQIDLLPAAEPLPAPVVLKIDAEPNVRRPSPESVDKAPISAATVQPDEPEPVASGILAVSSSTSTEIYIGDQYVGAAPVSMQMSAGAHTVEYRHGDLRKTLTHVIKSNETTKATITFEVLVSINAKPWADVYLDGIERKPLGQTPLSGVRVPIGGVLVFENSQFPGKKYRITGKETGIQIAFP